MRLTLALCLFAAPAFSEAISLGPRPFALVDAMRESPLKAQLEACADGPFKQSTFSIGHRGAPLQFPEHTEESYRAAARMGAGVLECDVTFTKDKALVCRHAQDDLHLTTNILATDLAAKCAVPFGLANGVAAAECRASDLTLAEFRTLRGKMDGADPGAKTVEGYMSGAPRWRTDLYASEGALMTHAESIELFRSLGVKFAPELKAPVVAMPHDGFSQADYAQALIDEYKQAGIPPEDVWPQSFNLENIKYWIENEPEFGAQAIYLDGRYRADIDPSDPSTFSPTMPELKAMGVNYIAPPLWMLVTSREGRIAPSAYAVAAREAGLRIIAWTVERSGPLGEGGGWYYQTIRDLTDNDGVVFELLHVLAQEVGVVGVFSDWPASTTYYASCFGLD